MSTSEADENLENLNKEIENIKVNQMEILELRR
jgi:hypothetical protein